MPNSNPAVQGFHLFVGFCNILLFELLLVPLLLTSYLYFFGNNFSSPVEARGWMTFFVMLGGGVAVFATKLVLPHSLWQEIWNQTSHSWICKASRGALVALIAAPLVVLFHASAVGVAEWLFQITVQEQIVVQSMREYLQFPLLLAALFPALALLVPITEEFFFRGLLQSWLKGKMRVSFAISLASLLFSSFHLSPKLGLSNIPLFASLFLLSCLLGILYEKQRSLFAPIALHGTFNALSLLFLAL